MTTSIESRQPYSGISARTPYSTLEMTTRATASAPCARLAFTAARLSMISSSLPSRSGPWRGRGREGTRPGVGAGSRGGVQARRLAKAPHERRAPHARGALLPPASCAATRVPHGSCQAAAGQGHAPGCAAGRAPPQGRGSAHLPPGDAPPGLQVAGAKELVLGPPRHKVAHWGGRREGARQGAPAGSGYGRLGASGGLLGGRPAGAAAARPGAHKKHGPVSRAAAQTGSRWLAGHPPYRWPASCPSR
jgi:hypothetical protein